ncbi:hypothetical protein LX64_00318 [Chitinophaga skermanii]|uniref:Secretin/TonB short N-terminal domain-containing protein n=1 Tax=Chitinophaga skermanii TaxID=331697 RepID=A0A327R433_9BACT|nr:STN domain-containing protein [Chitinophaga skermanii]RAJ10712.1 hypothetical protein LX64_00318 [Chitinophaga skermanii]
MNPAIKLILVSVLVISFTLMSTVFAQVNSNNRQGEIMVNIPACKVTLKTLFHDIEQQTGMTFFYNNRLVNVDEIIRFSCSNEKLDIVLRRLLHEKGVTWSYMDKEIVLRPITKERTFLQSFGTHEAAGIDLAACDDNNKLVITKIM